MFLREILLKKMMVKVFKSFLKNELFVGIVGCSTFECSIYSKRNFQMPHLMSLQTFTAFLSSSGYTGPP